MKLSLLPSAKISWFKTPTSRVNGVFITSRAPNTSSKSSKYGLHVGEAPVLLLSCGYIGFIFIFKVCVLPFNFFNVFSGPFSLTAILILIQIRCCFEVCKSRICPSTDKLISWFVIQTNALSFFSGTGSSLVSAWVLVFSFNISWFYWCPGNCTLYWTWNCSFCLQTWATWKVNFLHTCKVVILFKPFTKTRKWGVIHRMQIKLIASS